MNRRRSSIAFATIICAMGWVPIALSHHGEMPWNKSKVVVLDGFVSDEMDGYPHWEISLRVDGIDWEVDIGNDFVLSRAGLKPDGSDFRIGRSIRVDGYVPLDPEWRRIWPLRVYLDDKVFALRDPG